MKPLMAIILMLFYTLHSQATEHHINVYENRIDPEVLIIENGDQITWHIVNGRHQLISSENQAGFGFSSPVLPPGAQFTLDVETGQSGEVAYGTTLNPLLSAALVIEGPAVDYLIDEGINAHFYNPQTDGQGLLLEYVPNTQIVVAYWFTFGANNEQQWMLGTGTPQGNQVTMNMSATTGGQLNSDQVVSEVPWGELTLIFTDCFSGEAHYNGREQQLSGSFPFQRLYLAELCQ